MTLYPPWGVISSTFLITGAYSFIVGLDSAALYLATDSSLRRTIAKSPQKEVDFLQSLGRAEAERIMTNKIESISKQIYNNIQYDNLFAISSEPNNVREYVNQVVGELWNVDPDVLQKAKDKHNGKNHE